MEDVKGNVTQEMFNAVMFKVFKLEIDEIVNKKDHSEEIAKLKKSVYYDE